MTDDEKAAAYDRLCEMLFVPPSMPATAAYAEIEKLVDERNTARDALASTEQDLLRAECEVNHSHNMLGLVYNDLIVLETTLESVEQHLFLPINLCKYWKFPEWQKKRERYGSPEGRRNVTLTRLAAAGRLLDWMVESGRRTEPLLALIGSMSTWNDRDEQDDSWKEEWRTREDEG